MPDDHNVPVGGAGQPHFARVNFASDSVRIKVEDLLAESGGSLAFVDGQERRRIAALDKKFTGMIAAQDERFDIKLAALEDRLNARITYSQLATIIILTAVMGAFNIWG